MYISKLLKNPSRHQPRFPHRLTIVSHEFKRQRFCELHLRALKWPVDGDRVKYVGVDPPFDGVKMVEVREGDRKRGFGVWREDLYGVGSALEGKRIARGWTAERRTEFQREVVEKLDERDREAVRLLMEWGGGETGVELLPGRLPWE